MQVVGQPSGAELLEMLADCKVGKEGKDLLLSSLAPSLLERPDTPSSTSQHQPLPTVQSIALSAMSCPAAPPSVQISQV